MGTCFVHEAPQRARCLTLLALVGIIALCSAGRMVSKGLVDQDRQLIDFRAAQRSSNTRL
jgi:hypothetical protein